MILELGRRYRENQNAREEVMAPSIAMPVTRSVNASMGPGGATSIIQAVQGYPTAIAFVDATGQPWPIAWDTNSNPASDGQRRSRWNARRAGHGLRRPRSRKGQQRAAARAALLGTPWAVCW